MAYTKQYLEWDVPTSEVKSGVPVGHTVALYSNASFYPRLYQFSTFQEGIDGPVGRFFYSLDKGATWHDYPLGIDGKIFSSEYKMRMVVESMHAGYIYVGTDDGIYMLTPDGTAMVSGYTMDNIAAIGDGPPNAAWAITNGKTLYKFDSLGGLSPHNFSNALTPSTIAIAYDKPRMLFWSLGNNYLATVRDQNGKDIWSHVTSANASQIYVNPYTGDMLSYPGAEAGVIDEFHLLSRTVNSAAVSTPVQSLCHEKISSGNQFYVFTNGTNNIGEYSAGVVNVTYWDSSPYVFNCIAHAGGNTFYGLERANKRIVKFTAPTFTPVWAHTITADVDDGLINLVACSNQTVVTYDKHTVYKRY